MPTYQYACTECGERLEVVQRFSDDPLSVCSTCGGKLRKVFSPVGIVFKGSGFYRTDSRSGQVGAGASNGSGGADGKAGDGSSSSASGSDGAAKADGAGSKDSGSSGAGKTAAESGAGSSGAGSSSAGGSSESGSKVA